MTLTPPELAHSQLAHSLTKGQITLKSGFDCLVSINFKDSLMCNKNGNIQTKVETNFQVTYDKCIFKLRQNSDMIGLDWLGDDVAINCTPVLTSL